MIESLLTALRYQSSSSRVASSSATGSAASVSSLPTTATMAIATGETTPPADNHHTNAGLTTRLPPRVDLPSASVAVTNNRKEKTTAPRKVRFDPSLEIKIFEQHHKGMDHDQDDSCSSDNDDLQQQRPLQEQQKATTASPPKTKRSWSTKGYWYSAQDFLEMDGERQETVKAYQSNSLVPDQHCIRGLEVLISDDYFNQKARKRLMAQEQILTEQQRQRLLGVHHPDSFRILSSVFSKWAADSARDFGLADAVDACIIFNEVSPQENNNNGKPPKEKEVSCPAMKKRKLSY